MAPINFFSVIHYQIDFNYIIPARGFGDVTKRIQVFTLEHGLKLSDWNRCTISEIHEINK